MGVYGRSLSVSREKVNEKGRERKSERQRIFYFIGKYLSNQGFRVNYFLINYHRKTTYRRFPMDIQACTRKTFVLYSMRSQCNGYHTCRAFRSLWRPIPNPDREIESKRIESTSTRTPEQEPRKHTKNYY